MEFFVIGFGWGAVFSAVVLLAYRHVSKGEV